MSSVPAVTLSPEMARRLRTVARRQRDTTDARNRLIVEASTAGASLREIAAEVDLDHTGVRKIIRKAKEVRDG